MMKELTWNGRKARIWRNELPNWTYDVAEVVERDIPTNEWHKGETQHIALELWRPRDASYYGALGATFVPQPIQRLEVQICISANQGQLLQDTLASTIDVTRAGLPKEYAMGLLEAITQFDSTPSLGGGTLSFCRAIHSEVGSSIHVFQLIGRAIIRLLQQERLSLSDEALKELLHY